MTSHVARLYALVLSVLALVLAWAVIAAHPWPAAAAVATADARVVALAARERHLRAESIRVRHLVDARWARYRSLLKARRAQISKAQAAARLATATPSVRVINLPPLTITRTS